MTPDRPPLVSVVTPFFNTVDYLEQCIESVLRQTYSNWEYILIDNSSTDGSAEIAERYAKQDARIRFLKPERFVGQIENYNRALELIAPASRYCKMVQADDLLLPECLERMVAVAMTSERVGVVGSYSLYETELGHGGLPYRDCHVLSGREARRLYLLNGTRFFGSPTCVMFRSDLVRGRRHFFASDSPCEDLDVCFELLEAADFAFVHQVLTFNRRENGGYWARVGAFEALVLYDLLHLLRFGRACLTPVEYGTRLAELRGAYYRMLGFQIMTGASAEFWRFHREALAAVGEDVRWGRVAKEACLFGLDMALNPKRTLESVLRRWRVARPGGGGERARGGARRPAIAPRQSSGP